MMAYQSHASNASEDCLYRELKDQFPSLSPKTIRNCMRECANSTKLCKRILATIDEECSVNRNYNHMTNASDDSSASNSLAHSLSCGSDMSRLEHKISDMRISNSSDNFDTYIGHKSDFSKIDSELQNINSACANKTLPNNPSPIKLSPSQHSGTGVVNKKNFFGYHDDSQSSQHFGLFKSNNDSAGSSSNVLSSISSSNSTSPSIISYDRGLNYIPAEGRRLNQLPPAMQMSNANQNRHISRLYVDPQMPHYPTHLPTSPRFQHSTSVNYAITPTPRHTITSSHFQPLYINTEGSGGGVTAISTNFSSNSQHEYLPNTTLPSPQLKIQHGYPIMSYSHEPTPLHDFKGNRMPLSQTVQQYSVRPQQEFPPDISMQNVEESYKQTLINLQRSSLHKLKEKFFMKKKILSELKAEVFSLENQLIQKQFTDIVLPLEELQELPKLREETRNLKIKCQCLAWKVDLNSRDNDEDFFSQINTGPSMPTKKGNGKKNAQAPSSPKQKQKDEKRKQWNCVKCTFLNDDLMDKCEMCTMVRIPEPGGNNSGNEHSDSCKQAATAASSRSSVGNQRLQHVHIQLIRNNNQTNNVKLNIKVIHPRR